MLFLSAEICAISGQDSLPLSYCSHALRGNIPWTLRVQNDPALTFEYYYLPGTSPLSKVSAGSKNFPTQSVGTIRRILNPTLCHRRLHKTRSQCFCKDYFYLLPYLCPSANLSWHQHPQHSTKHHFFTKKTSLPLFVQHPNLL